MSVDADFSDLIGLAADFRAAADKVLPRARMVLQKSAADMKADAQRLAPVDTGNLRSSITYETRQLGAAVEGTVGPTAEYGEYVEFGTARMAPQPYLGPSFDRHVSAFVNAMSQVCGEVF